MTSPQRYQLQFETVEEHVLLLERAKALMARERPGASLGELHLEAMKLLVASLEKRKFAVGAAPRAPRERRPDVERGAPVRQDDDERRIQPRRRGAESIERCAAAAGRDSAAGSDLDGCAATAGLDSAAGSDLTAGRDSAAGSDLDGCAATAGRDSAEGSDPIEGLGRGVGGDSGSAGARWDGLVASRCVRGRHIPAELQREVYQRDEGRCSYVDWRDQRCCETRYLELHHLEPFAQGGAHATSNLTLRCAAHNRLAAEQDFGQSHVVARRDSARHESLARQLVSDGGD